MAPLSPKPPEPSRETWIHERYRASQLTQILRMAGVEKVTGQITLNLSQGTVTGLEVRMKVKESVVS